MSIWFNDEFPLAYVNERGSNTLNANLGIEITEAGEDVLKGRMPVDERTVNPAGVLHGGASIVFAETLASWASTFVVDPARQQCVGLDINGNHLRPAMAGGMVYGEARPELLGRKTQVWTVRIHDEAGKLVCVSRVTMAVLDKPSLY
ncbi:PaaI family thioesterase [Pseudomonas sp. Marseille-Q8238]